MQARAAITDGRGGVHVDFVEVAAPLEDEVRILLGAAGICRTDLDALNWGYSQVLGHEGAGVVIDVGPEVTAFATGDAVLLNWAVPCGACHQCAGGHPALCERTQSAHTEGAGSSNAHRGGTSYRGAPIDRMFTLGALAEVALVRAAAVTRIDPGLPFAQACILGCAVMTGVGSVLNVARVQPGEAVAVLGCGGVGLCVVQGARIAGAERIVAIDSRQSRLDLALTLGATDVVLVKAEEGSVDALVESVRALTGGRGADHAFEATGVPGLAFVPLRLVRNGGTALQLSGPVDRAMIDTSAFAWNKVFAMPLYGDCVPERDVPKLLSYRASGALDLASMVTRRYRLDDIAEAFDDLRAGCQVKGVVEFTP